MNERDRWNERARWASAFGYPAKEAYARRKIKQLTAQAIEAQRAETENTGSVADESAVAKPCAQTEPKGAI